MKSPILAFTLSFFLPGAGLGYLGKWKWAIVNFAVVLLICIAATFILSNEAFDQCSRYIAAGCAGVSGGLASAIAKQLNQKR